MNGLTVSQDIDVTTDDITVVTDFDVEVIQTFDEGPPGPQGPVGGPGPPGPAGPQGQPGNTIRYGTRDPTLTDGVPGDSWINTATNMLFGPKSPAGAWPAGVSLIGAQGPQGPQGMQGAKGDQGNPGVDGNTVLYGTVDPAAGVGVNGNFYINTTTHFMFGPKAAGAWPAGVSLIGPQGPQGIPGNQGIQGPPGEVPEAPQDSKTYGRKNAGWVEVTGGGAAIMVATDPPAGAADNSLWWESDTGITYLRYFDGTSRQWVAITESNFVGAVRFDAPQTLSPAQQVQARINIGSPFFAPQGRLTLQSGVPVMVTTQASKNTMYFTPDRGNLVPIFDGAFMAATSFAELSVLASDTTKNPSPIAVAKVNDWFVWNDNGTMRLGHGPDWTNDTSPSAGTALVTVNGIKLNAVAITNGPAAQRGTWVGTTRSDSAGNFSWIYGGSAAGGVSGFFGVWNAYNRRLVTSQTIDTAGSYNSANGVLVPLLNSLNDRTNYVCGAQEESFTGKVFSCCNTTSTSFGSVFIGYDTVAAASFGLCSPATSATTLAGCSGEFSVASAPGFHFMQALQYATNGAAATFYGSGTGTGISSGMSWQGMM